ERGELRARARPGRAARLRGAAAAWYIGSQFPRLASPARALPEAHGRNPRRERSPAPSPRPGARLTSMRKAEIQRDTKETRIHVALDLDGAGKSKLASGIPRSEEHTSELQS